MSDSKKKAGFDVYILAGGKSRRFGSDKARAEAKGVAVIVRVAEALASVAGTVTVVADRAGRYDDLGLHTIGDLIPEKGPIGGLLTAIDRHTPDEWIFVAACDWVGIRREWIQCLADERARAAAGSAAVVFRSRRGFEPLFGFYCGSIRETVALEIDNGRLKMQDLLAGLDTVAVAVPDNWDEMVNLNRPDGR